MSHCLYLLTGATGLLGGNIVRALVERGDMVCALVMRNDPAAASMPKEVCLIEGDLLNQEALERFFTTPGPDERIVIHAASIVTIDPRPNEKVRAVNVDGTRNIVEQCLKHKVRKLVYVSSTSVIPEPPAGQIIREIDNYSPDSLVGYYAQTKALATELVMEAARDHGLDASIVCPSGIFGPNDYGFGLITSCVTMVARGHLPVTIGGTFNSVDARDLAAGILSCAERGRAGEAYIMASRCYTFVQLIETIQATTGRQKKLPYLPLWLVRPFAGLGSLYGKITRRPAWFSSFTIYNLERNNNYSFQKAERELGFCCRPLDQSIQDTIIWLEQEGKLIRRQSVQSPKHKNA